MEKETKVKKFKIRKIRMGYKFLRMFFYKAIKRRWYLPHTSEITVDELFERINSDVPPLIFDHRPAGEFQGPGKNEYMTIFGHIPNSFSMPIMNLASNLEDLQSFMELVTDFKDLQSFKDKEIVTICPGGGMSLVGVDIMVEAGFTDVKSLKGGIVDWSKKGYPLIDTPADELSPPEDTKPNFSTKTPISEEKQPSTEKYLGEVHNTVDARNFSCPRPILMSKKAINKLKVGQVLEILTTDPGSKVDIPSWVHATGQELIVFDELGPKKFRFIVKKMK